MKILIVEDDPTTRTAMQRVLGGLYKHEVMMGFNAQAAIHLLANEPAFDVVLLDIDLGAGQVTGWAVAGYMMTDPKLRKVPIIVVSGMAPHEVREGAKSYANVLVNAALIVGKPLSINELLKAIDTVTQKDAGPNP